MCLGAAGHGRLGAMGSRANWVSRGGAFTRQARMGHAWFARARHLVAGKVPLGAARFVLVGFGRQGSSPYGIVERGRAGPVGLGSPSRGAAPCGKVGPASRGLAGSCEDWYREVGPAWCGADSVVGRDRERVVRPARLGAIWLVNTWNGVAGRERGQLPNSKFQMLKKPIIDPQSVAIFEEKIAQELLRFVPGPGAPDDIDVRDAKAIAPLLKRFDWPMIQKIGSWLFSDYGWPDWEMKRGKKVRTIGAPSNDTMGRLRGLLKREEVEGR